MRSNNFHSRECVWNFDLLSPPEKSTNLQNFKSRHRGKKPDLPCSCSSCKCCTFCPVTQENSEVWRKEPGTAAVTGVLCAFWVRTCCVYYRVQRFFGVSRRHAEASSGLDDGRGREAHDDHTYVPLQHLPTKRPGHNTHTHTLQIFKIFKILTSLASSVDSIYHHQ